MAVSKLSILKTIELALTVTCLVLHYQTLSERQPHTILLAAGSFVGYTIILVGLFIGYAVQTPANKRVDILYSLVGCALFIASGALIIQEWEDSIFKTDARKLALTKGGLAIVTGVVFFVDAIFTFRD